MIGYYYNNKLKIHLLIIAILLLSNLEVDRCYGEQSIEEFAREG